MLEIAASDLVAAGIATAVWLLVWKLRFAPKLDEIRARERARRIRVRDHRPRWKAALHDATANLYELAPDRHSMVFVLMPVFALVCMMSRLMGCDWAH